METKKNVLETDIPCRGGDSQLLQTKPKKLWSKLKNLLLKKDDFQVRQQLYMNLFKQIPRQDNVIEYIYEENDVHVLIKQQKQKITLEEIKKYNEGDVDSTGVSLWPAEELLAYYCLKNMQIFQSMKHIAEYGAGYSGLAGITLAKSLLSIPDHPILSIDISDGHEECSRLLKENVEINNYPQLDSRFQKCVSSRQFVWGKEGQELPEDQRFDCILIADCLFFKNYHYALIKTIQDTLASKGICIIIAPQRGGTLNEFLNKCDGQLQVEHMDFDDIKFKKTVFEMKQNPLYNPDMHDYHFLKIRNNISSSN